MSVAPKNRPVPVIQEDSPPPSNIESAAWWLPMPGWLNGVASIGGVFGAIPFNAERFHPAVDGMLLQRDGTMLLYEFKNAYNQATREFVRDENAPQQRLFDPDEQ